jgi:hypothetical protein
MLERGWCRRWALASLRLTWGCQATRWRRARCGPCGVGVGAVFFAALDNPWESAMAMESIPGARDAQLSDLLDLSPDCPWRPAGWRWELAMLRVRGERRLRRLDDVWARRAARFLRHAARRGRAHAESLDPAVTAALRLRGEPDGRDRLAIECHVLTGLDVSEIAARVGLPVEVVAAYAELFFDVRSYLTAPDRVVLTAIDPGASLHDGTAGPAVVARLLSFIGGPLVAEAVLDLLAADPVREPPVLLGPSGGADIASSFRSILAVLSMPVDERSGPLFLRLARRLWEIERDESARSASPLAAPVMTVSDVLASPIVPEAAPGNVWDVGIGGPGTDRHARSLAQVAAQGAGAADAYGHRAGLSHAV